MSKRSNHSSGSVMLPGAHRQVHQRAQGWAVYWYAWRGGPQLARFGGATLEEAQAAELAGAGELARAWADATDTRPAIGQFGRVVTEYTASHSYKELKPATKKTYRVWLDRIYEEFGHLSEREIDADKISPWRKRIIEKHGVRAADHALRIFSRVVSFGKEPEQRLLSPNFFPHKGFKKLYRAPPQDAWRPEWLEKIPQIPHPEVRWALMLALNTGLRRADLVELPWSAIDHQMGVIRWMPSKGRRLHRRVSIPITGPLRATLDLIPKRSTIILTNRWERPWTVNGLAHAVHRELHAVNIAGTLHGLRRSAATHLAALGWSSRKIAQVMGWSETEAEAMTAIYIDDERLFTEPLVSLPNRQPGD